MRLPMRLATLVAALTAALATASVPGIAAAATRASQGALNRAASLPGPGDVVRGRFVAPVALDAGTLEVVPAPAGDRPHVPEAQAAQEIWASPVLQSRTQGPLGYGLVTISLRVKGVPHVTKLPAWVGFAKSSGMANCPEESPTTAEHLDLDLCGPVGERSSFERLRRRRHRGRARFARRHLHRPQSVLWVRAAGGARPGHRGRLRCRGRR